MVKGKRVAGRLLDPMQWKRANELRPRQSAARNVLRRFERSILEE